MPSAPLHRKVLVLMEEASIRNLLQLVKRLEPENAADGDGKSELSTINRKQFDTVILDLRCSKRRPGDEVHGVGQLRPSMVGKLLVINAEVNGPKTLDMVERYLTNGLPQSLLWLICHR